MTLAPIARERASRRVLCKVVPPTIVTTIFLRFKRDSRKPLIIDSRISNGLLFDPNTQVTWDRFKGQAVPFLQGVKARLGLEDFKVVLDTTTTTPDLVDRNVMYAKIFLKPTRAIEFIAVDFVITNTGASFED